MNFEEIKEYIESSLIGTGNSERVFGKYWSDMYKYISEIDQITENDLKKGFENTNIKNPEKVGLISLLLPVAYLDLANVVFINQNKFLLKVYRISLTLFNFFLILSIVNHIIEGYVDGTLVSMCLVAIFTSFSFRSYAKLYNTLEFFSEIVKLKNIQLERNGRN